MITGPVPVSPHDTPKPRRSHQSARALSDWIAAVEADDQPDLHSFAYYDVVRNGLTLPLELRSRGRRRHQDDQAPDVRPRRLPAAPQACPGSAADSSARTAEPSA